MSLLALSALWFSTTVLSLASFHLDLASIHPHNVLPTQQLGAGSILGAIAGSDSPHTSLEIEKIAYSIRCESHVPSDAPALALSALLGD
jgi:hypothetical protein